MKSHRSQIIETPSIINYPYATIRITKSRLDKGLIAIPVSLAERFPDHNETIQVFLNDSPISQTKQYSSYSSSTRECRIGGVKGWFKQNNVKSGDEIVIQFIDPKNYIYRLIPERRFIMTTKELQGNLDVSETEREASEKIIDLTQWTRLDTSKVILSEFYRLSNVSQSESRQYSKRSQVRTRESVPANLRTLLGDIYKGRCQVCDFWFLKRDSEPYFEIHHLNPLKGHHPKNLLVVCGNCHNQFEHAKVKLDFGEEQWLVRVLFNESVYSVRQALSDIKMEFSKELFI